MKWVKTAIGAVIAIAVIPMIAITSSNMINLQAEIPVTFEILNENNNFSDITLGSYESLIENKKITNYRISSEYPLVKNSEIEISKYFIDEELKNEMYTDVDGQPWIRENVVKMDLWKYEWNPYPSMHDDNTYIFQLNILLEHDVVLPPTSTEMGRMFVNYFENITANEVFGEYKLGVGLHTSGNLRIREERHLIQAIMTRDSVDEATAFKTYLEENNIHGIFELEVKEPRLAETYDLTSFQLDFHDHSLSILFDINDEYQRWRIYEGDVLQMLDGEQIVGNKWTVTFEVYEVQSPILRSLIALVPIIFISGVLSYFLVTFKETE